jgi:Rad3-related DNA helicase
MGLPLDTPETTSSRLIVTASPPPQTMNSATVLQNIDQLAAKRQQQAVVENEIIISAPIDGTQSEAAIDEKGEEQSSNQQTLQISPTDAKVKTHTEQTQQLQSIHRTLPQAKSVDEDWQEEESLPEKREKEGFTGTHLHHVVDEDLRQGGILSQSLPGYEERPAQIEMATFVSRAISQRNLAIIEAATGTGKSLAYLVPIVRSGQVAIVSTANKALQEQLYYKDIPFVQKHIKHFEAALVKGVNNYICLDRLESERIGMQAFAKNRDFQRLYEYINDPDTGLDFTGDFETLGFQLPRDIRSRIATESDQCAWKKCSFFEDCYVREMRERAEQAQIIVVNHTLLLLDAAMDGFLLPERDLIVLDEAHHLEEEATRSFTITIHPNQVQTLLAQHLLKNHSLLSLQDETMRAAQNLWSRLEQTINPGFKGRANLERPFEEGLRLATTLDDLTDSLRKQRPKDLPDKEGQLYDKLLKRAQNLADSVRTVFSVAEPNKYVYYAERVEGSQSRGFVFQASAAPLDVTSWLNERLFKKYNVIATSATLATVSSTPATTAKTESKGPNFNYFRRRIGLDPIQYPDVLENILPLTFDYEQNALLYLPRDLPAPTFGPGAEEYMTDLAREMYRLTKLSHGRAFLLFSSKRMLDFAFELMAPHLPYPLLKQGDMTRMELTRRFREEEGAVLFGLKSFWEGVDIAGDALSLVVIDKLPFDPPDDPVHEARVAQMKAAGENWFGDYVLPQAVLRLKQGIGRLLRTREDRGVMAILDTRLHTKGYGRQVLNALPPARRSSNIRDVERFFSSHSLSG